MIMKWGITRNNQYDITALMFFGASGKRNSERKGLKLTPYRPSCSSSLRTDHSHGGTKLPT